MQPILVLPNWLIQRLFVRPARFHAAGTMLVPSCLRAQPCQCPLPGPTRRPLQFGSGISLRMLAKSENFAPTVDRGVGSSEQKCRPSSWLCLISKEIVFLCALLAVKTLAGGGFGGGARLGHQHWRGAAPCLLGGCQRRRLVPIQARRAFLVWPSWHQQDLLRGCIQRQYLLLKFLLQRRKRFVKPRLNSFGAAKGCLIALSKPPSKTEKLATT